MFKRVLGASVVGLATAETPDYVALWSQFKVDYNKDYSSNGEDEQKRYETFKVNVDIIEQTNAQGLSYELGINEFADLTSEEFKEMYISGYVPTESLFGDVQAAPFPNVTGVEVPDSVDWVSKGAVTPVKNQGRCGSCWAFSSTGALEGALFVSSGKLVSLSEEDLVQCDTGGSKGCQGGSMEQAFQWVKQNGICTEAADPYTSGGGVTGTCKRTCKPAVTATSFTQVPTKNKDALQAAVAKQPVSIAIEADKSAFQLYKGGVLSAKCGTKLDHGVLLVGYGTDGGSDYWKVKNSWGPAWGEQGYVRMSRKKNECGLLMQPVYPTGVKSIAENEEIVV